MLIRKIQQNSKIICVLSLCLLLRLYFSIDGSKYYFGDVVHTWKDTYTYFDAFYNWYTNGNYQFDPNEPDSRFFRPPIYPFFLGFFYLISPQNYEQFVAYFQIILDAVSCYFIYKTIKSISNERSALLSAFLFSIWPFSIVWSPILYTETLLVFYLTTTIYLTLTKNGETFPLFISGIISGIAFLTKQYAILIIIFPITYCLLGNQSFKIKTQKLTTILCGCILVMTPWIYRNYLVSGKLIVTRGESTGIIYYGRDFEAFERFVNLFDQNVTPHRSSIAHKGTIVLKNHPRFIADNQNYISEAAAKAYECGPSFTSLRGVSVDEAYGNDCTDEVVEKFRYLTKLAHQQLTVSELLQTRIEAMLKVFIGNTFAETKPFMVLLYLFRTIIITLSFTILLLPSKITGISKKICAPFLTTFTFFSALFSFWYVHVEIRYMLLPEILLLTILPVYITKLISNRSSLKINVHRS